MPEYVMVCRSALGVCLAWAGQLRSQDNSEALRNSSHAIQDVTEVDVAHCIMERGEIHWEGTLEFDYYHQYAKDFRAMLDEWKSHNRMEEKFSVSKSVQDVDFEQNRSKVIVEVIINSSSFDYQARIVIGYKLAYEWFSLKQRRAGNTILMRAKKHMLADKKYAGCKIWFDYDKAGTWRIKFIDLVD